MKYLGLDLGTKTLGIAISDLTHTIATSNKILKMEENNYESLIEPIKKIIEEEQIEKIILGFPINMDNTIRKRGEDTLLFKKLLEEKIKLPVILQDERLSTKEAHNYMLEADMSRKKRKQKIDSLAASIILQTYLDKEKKNG
ncbi:MAG: Holliday junction resolvase RuvX [Bacilli bacterium]|nr:Holliday junction resolvase RuvX [Bacilli bacterium]